MSAFLKKNSNKRGNKIEADLEKKFIEAGALTCRAQRKIMWIPDFKGGKVFNPKTGKVGPKLMPISKRVDLFDRFDLIVKLPEIKDSDHSLETWYIQAATVWKSGEDRRKLENFPINHLERVFMVMKKLREPYRVKELVRAPTPKGWWTEVSLDHLLSIISNGKESFGFGYELQGENKTQEATQ